VDLYLFVGAAIVAIFVVDAIARWRRQSAWKRKMRDQQTDSVTENVMNAIHPDAGSPSMIHHDRRSPDRPKPGEMQVCPKCNGVMRFDERFVLIAGRLQRDPAWVCLNATCQHQQQVRQHI
jgi:hypothetical protein